MTFIEIHNILGQQQVQGVDYAYTLQGWLKGVNSMALDTAIDMGKDGGGTITARDAYGYQLNYFRGDYKAVNVNRNPFPGHSAYIGAAYRPLYNGNISSMGVNIGKLSQPQLYNYEYDQLNRLVGMQAFRNFNQSGNSWSGMSGTSDHQEAVTYDGNGNITAYLRNGNASAGKPLAMDNLGYHYNKDGSGNLLNNRLRHVTDGVTAANYSEDIDSQGVDNYHYDQIGNLTRDSQEQIDSIEWNVYGKISRIMKTVVSTTGALQQIAYSYDPSGNRISKTVYSNQDGGNYKAVHTWYVRDASGNVMATYSSEDIASKSTLATGTLGKLYLSELHLYGSSRLGIWNRKVDMDEVPGSGGTVPLLGTIGIDTFNRGQKFFELANHLGNVLVTVSDRKVGQNPVNGLYSSYTAEVVSASDYAPFGMQMVGRTFSSGAYRYGFNGKENDNEVKGEGNQQDYGMRIYDPRIGKFLSVDPLTKQYPWLSPYQYASNSPIANVDLDGLETQYAADGRIVFGPWAKDPVKGGWLYNTPKPSIFNYNEDHSKGNVTKVPAAQPRTAKQDNLQISAQIQLAKQRAEKSLEPTSAKAYAAHMEKRDHATIGPPSPRRGYSDFEWEMITSPATHASIGMMLPGYNFTIASATTYDGIRNGNY